MNYSKKQVLIIDFLSLPEIQQQAIKLKYEQIHNDCLKKLVSEFLTKELNQENLIKYFTDQTNENNYKGSFRSFINDYGLTFEKFLIDQNVDLTNIDEIFIEFFW